MFHPIKKAWGSTFRFPRCTEVHYAIIEKGGESSYHHHPREVNAFFVTSGKLKIVREIGEPVVLTPHHYMAVESGQWHSFEALEDTTVIEFYTGDEGIVRERRQT